MSERTRRSARGNNSQTQAGLERLKKLRSGEQRAIDFDKEEEDVYDYVDDDEYGEMVRKRTEENFIVDDDGATGYYEDGREIFDDVDDQSNDADNKYAREYENYGSSNKNKKVPLKRRIDDEENGSKQKKKMGNMKNYLISNQKKVQKKTFDQMNVEDDDLLKGILDDLNTTPATNKASSQKSLGQTNGKNKRKLADFDDDDLIGTPNNPFSVASETNYVSNKKARTESFEDLDDDSLFDNELPDNLFEQPSVSKSNDDYEVTGDELARPAEQSFSVDNYQLSNDDNLIADENENKLLKIYWIDAYEDQKQPGTVYLFGKVYVEKVDKYFSCCLICKNVEQKIYIYKRTHHKLDTSTIVRQEDFEQEVKRALEHCKIRNYRSRMTTKNYAFDKEIETKGEYLEVLFNPTVNSKIPSNLSGDTFSHVFNYSQSSLERFIIDLKLMGPTWLKIKNPLESSPPISWCKFEYIVDNPFKQISIDTNDQTEVPLSIMTISLKTHLNQTNKQTEIVALSCMTNNEYFINKNASRQTKKSNDTVDNIDNFCFITEPSKRSTEGSANNQPIKFPLKFKDVWNKKVHKGLNTQINVFPTEKDLIMNFITKLYKKDPDVLIGHDLDSFDLNILKKRLEHHKVLGQNWSKLGKLKRCVGQKANSYDMRHLSIGRLVCDVEVAAKELIRSKSYDLKELALQILKKEQIEFKPENLFNYYKSIDNVLEFIKLCVNDTQLVNGLFTELNVLPLYSEITKIAGNLFSRTLLGGRSERNEYLLLHAFNEHNYILPDKVFNDKKAVKISEDIDNVEERAAATLSSNKRNKKAAYTGGLVLDPKVGLHDKYILLMDFNSLYPSIIQEYKICFTTVDRQQFLECLKDSDGDLEKQPEIRSENVNKDGYCILPKEIKKLVDERRKVKGLMLQPNATADLKQQLDIKQKALKLTANSMYGCLGFSNSRFYAKPLASLITLKGREILSKTKQLVEESSLKLEVIYGDTDSLMINTKALSYEEAESLGYKLKAEVNKNYNLLEIDIDGIFKSILLLKKKKYAALVAKKVNGKIMFEREIKGLDIIRRDWSLIAKNVGENVLKEILTEENRPSEQIIENIHNYLALVAKQINDNELPKAVYHISKQLTKDPKEYKDAKGQPHALVAIRWNENVKNERKFKSGDVINYLICKSKSNKDNFNSLPATQRAFHMKEFKENDDLEIDSKYYLQSQIHPVVSRLVDPIDGTDANVIAEFLGIESSFTTGSSKGTDLDYELLTRTNETRFDTCKALVFTCPKQSCKQTISVRSLIEKDTIQGAGKFKLNLEKCPYCSECLADDKYKNYFSNHLTIYLRSLLSDYYQTWYTCEDPICKFRTRRITSLMTKKGPICPECNENVLYSDITDAQIYLQFNFFTHLLDWKKAVDDLPKLENSEHLKEIKSRILQSSKLYKRLSDVVLKFKQQQAYDVVDLTFLFSKQVFSVLNLN